MMSAKVIKYHMSGEDNNLIREIFVGNVIHNLDPKKRITIPSEWRGQMKGENNLYVLPGIDEKCLWIFPANEMQKRIEKMRQQSFTDLKVRQFARILGSQSELLPLDSQGRIRIRDELLNFAGLVDEVKVVGAFIYFELWNPENWEKCQESGGSSLKDAARYVGF